MCNTLKKYRDTINYCFKLSFDSSKKYSIARIFIKIIVPLISVVLSIMTKNIIDLVVVGQNSHKLYTALIFISILMILVAVLENFSQYISLLHNDLITNHINKVIISFSGQADLRLFDDPQYYDKLLMAKRDSNAIVSFVWSIYDLISSLISIVLSFTILTQINIYYGFAMLLLSIPVAVASQQFTQKIYDLNIKQLPDERKKQYYNFLLTEKNFAQEIRLFGNAMKFIGIYNDIWKSIFFIKKEMEKKKLIIVSLFNTLPFIGILVISILLINSIFANEKTIGDYTLCMSLINQLSVAAMAAISHSMQFYEQHLKVENIMDFCKTPNQVLNKGIISITYIHEIHFDDVYFKYPNSTNYVLNGFTMRINSGETVALLGENGTGKSTILKMLLRFYDTEKGAIYINKIDIKQIEIGSLRSCFSTYFQNALNYAFTLEDNVVLGNVHDDYTHKNVRDALYHSGGSSLIEKANQNLNVSVTKMFDANGLELSYGEHQKLALARTLFRRSSVILFDEPSSSLDNHSEEDLLRTINDDLNNNIVIIISHKSSTVKSVDRVIHIIDGKASTGK